VINACGVDEDAEREGSAGCWARPGRDEVDLYELRHACATPLLTTRA
jgi:hypothetical protein